MYKRARTTSKYAPVAVTAQVHQTSGQQGIWLRGREFLANINGSAAYSKSVNVLRPTDYGVFSWLASIARKFNNYKFRDLRLIFEPTCASTAIGSVGIFFDPDPSNTGPANWSAFVNTGANTHGAPWVRHQLIVPKRDFASRKEFYVKDEYPELNAPSAPVIDPLEHYPGIYGYAVEGQVDAAPVGKLYLEYSISLWKSMSDSPPCWSVSQNSLNPVVAQNSGAGMFVTKATNAAGPGITQLYGYDAGAGQRITTTDAGFGYFSKNATTGVLTAVQTVEVCICIGAAAAGGTVAQPFIFLNGADITGVAAKCQKLWMSPDPAGTTATVQVSYLVKITKGDTFFVRVTTGTAACNSFAMTITPCVFGLNQ